jgi:hypothetical protein
MGWWRQGIHLDGNVVASRGLANLPSGKEYASCTEYFALVRPIAPYLPIELAGGPRIVLYCIVQDLYQGVLVGACGAR